MKKTSSDGLNWYWKQSVGGCGKRIAEQMRQSLRYARASPRPGKKRKKISRTASNADIPASKNSENQSRKLVYGDWSVHGGEMYDCGAGAEFDALAVVVPILAAFGANGRVALERAVTFGFHQHAGLIAGGNFYR
jgi:hypothetical protein